MISLIQKDLILIKKSTKIMTFLPLLFCLIIASQNKSMIMPTLSLMISLILASFVVQSMQLDEVSNWSKFVSAMPVSRLQEAGSKYLLNFLFAITSGLIILIIGFVTFMLNVINIKLIFIYSGASFVYSLLYGTISIPIAYRFGTALCRHIFFGFVLIPVALILLLNQLGFSVDINKLKNLSVPIIILIIFIGICAISWLSIYLTLIVFKKNKL